MNEQKALDTLSLYAKSNWQCSWDIVRKCGICQDKLQKLIDKQGNIKPISIEISKNKKMFHYCGKCRGTLLRKYKYCPKCGSKIDW